MRFSLKHVLSVGVVAGLLLGTAGITRADGDSPFGFHGGLYWYGYHSLRRDYVDQPIPYFAQFPPVYYSHPVPRPYGWSPYAYPPDVRTPEPKARPAAVQVINPYVKPRGDEKEAPLKSASAPRVIVNPFVAEGDGTRVASTQGIAPQVVYPAAHGERQAE